ncbi:uncharacterized protein LOC135954910 [Calliphora vicina]|uniref:uncharacterized protein LOC135954910 n=1 Tax=Calliphora vicina TaxID=7373 RepID=UPI00325A9713
MSRKKVTSLSIKEKIQIIKEIEEQQIAKKRICLKYKCDISTVNRILKRKDEIYKAAGTTNLKQKRNRKGLHDNVEKALRQWFDQQRSKGAVVSSMALLKKSKEFAVELEEDFEPDKNWLFRWKRRQNIKIRPIHRDYIHCYGHLTETEIIDVIANDNSDIGIENVPEDDEGDEELPTEMNLKYDTFIKQEFLNDEDDLLTTLPRSNLNILVKNEPISDDISPLVTIKTEEFLEEPLIKEGVTVKTENQLTASENSFIIYELETPPPSTRTLPPQILQNDKQIITESKQISPQMQVLSIPQHNQLAINTIPAVKSHLQHIPISNKTVPAVTSSPPILLNSQFRKRHRVILPANAIHKKTRYNIDSTTTESLATQSVKRDPMSSTKTLNKCRLLNTGSRKIINHYLIKPKRNQSQQEESPKILDNALTQEDSTEKSNPLIEEPIIEPQIEQTSGITTQTEINPSYSLITPAKTENSLILPKETNDDPPVMPELRVKCLCSLTANSDTSMDTTDLKAFFQEMFEKTRRLSKKHQRLVKMTLLEAVSEAEELMEQGKCCGF